MKTCSICLIPKEESEFSLYQYKGQTKQKSHCKPCYRTIRHNSWIKHRNESLRKSKTYYTINKEKIALYHAQNYIKNKPKQLQRNKNYRSTLEGKIQQWKWGAKRRKISWEVSDTFLKHLPLICYYTGIELTMEIGHPNTLSIDRVNSNQPYTETNIVPCCSIVNIMKSDLSKEIFIETCKKIASYTPQLLSSS